MLLKMEPGELSWLSSLALCAMSIILVALLTVCSVAQLSQCHAVCLSHLCGHVWMHDIVLTHTSCEQCGLQHSALLTGKSRELQQQIFCGAGLL